MLGRSPCLRDSLTFFTALPWMLLTTTMVRLFLYRFLILLITFLSRPFFSSNHVHPVQAEEVESSYQVSVQDTTAMMTRFTCSMDCVPGHINPMVDSSVITCHKLEMREGMSSCFFQQICFQSRCYFKICIQQRYFSFVSG